MGNGYPIEVDGWFFGLKVGEVRIPKDKETLYDKHEMVIDGWCREKEWVFVTVKNWRGYDLPEVFVGREEILWLLSPIGRAVYQSAYKISGLMEAMRTSRIFSFLKWNR